jgi:hypothetical protein
MKSIRGFLTDGAGPTAIEYGLIAGYCARGHYRRERPWTNLETKLTLINNSLK